MFLRDHWKGPWNFPSCMSVLVSGVEEGAKPVCHMTNIETGNRSKQQMVDAETGDVVGSDPDGRGYELKNGRRFVEIDKEDLGSRRR